MKPYKKIREFSSTELQEEVGEYFENPYTKSRFPNLAKDETHLKKMIKSARLVSLSESDMLRLENSDVGDILSSSNPYHAVFKMAKSNGRDIDRIYAGVKSDTPFPAPIVINKNGQLYLMAGNTRICAFAAINLSISVKVIVC